MGEFLTGKKLKNRIIDIIETAEKKLIIVSPYIRLHENYLKTLEKRIDDNNLQTTLIFRKEKEGQVPSININDLEVFKSFRKISIYANHRLHAKLYANESGLLVTSMNLYKFSQVNDNIEFGVYYPINSSLKNRQDLYIRSNVQQTLQKIIAKSTTEFTNISTDQHNLFTAYYANLAAQCIHDMVIPPKIGYCIRTGISIPFNIRKPYCTEAYMQWKQDENFEAKEEFCHLTGERSGETTTFKKPIAYSNWQLLRKKFPNFVAQLTEAHSLIL